MADKWIQLQSSDGEDNLFPKGKMELLWTNSAPTSSFSAQTVQLDLTNYGMVAIMVEESTSYSDYLTTYYVPVGAKKYEILQSFSNLRYRYVNVTSAGVGFEAGNKYATYGTKSTDNSLLIPYQIYGIKMEVS